MCFVRDLRKVPDVVELGFEVCLIFGNIAIFQVTYYLAYGCEIHTDLLRNPLLCPALQVQIEDTLISLFFQLLALIGSPFAVCPVTDR